MKSRTVAAVMAGLLVGVGLMAFGNAGRQPPAPPKLIGIATASWEGGYVTIFRAFEDGTVNATPFAGGLGEEGGMFPQKRPPWLTVTNDK